MVEANPEADDNSWGNEDGSDEEGWGDPYGDEEEDDPQTKARKMQEEIEREKAIEDNMRLIE